MRRAILAVLTALLLGHGLAFAQPVAEYTNAEDLAGQAILLDAPAQPGGSKIWGSADYLLWWIKDGAAPPLVTAGGNGIPGAPGTQIVVDDLDFANDLRQGGRFALGYNFDSVGIEARYFFLSEGQAGDFFVSGGSPVLGRPYLNVATSLPAATLISLPGVASGSVALGARTWLSGAEANLTRELVRSDRVRWTALGGFRFLRIEDELQIGELFRVAPSVPGFGGNTVGLIDQFRTDNRFYGGQLGLETAVQLGRLSLDFWSKLALGQMQQTARIHGTTNVLAPDGSTTVFTGGLLALRSNIGTHERDVLAFMPEVGLNVGLQVTSWLKLHAGYTLLWVSSVARAGEQIDPVVNESQFPILSGNGPLVGAARPALLFNGNDFWAQGLNFGLELSY